MTVLDADGRMVKSAKLGTERWELLEFFGQVEKPAALAVEATFNWYYFLNLMEPLGLELHLVHPGKTRAIASARIKHDKLDSRILAELLRTGFLAEAWIAPRPVREQRQLLRYRVHTVQWATGAKNSIHGILNRNGVRSPLRSIFGPQGRQFLREVELPATDRWEVNGQLERLDLLGRQLAALDREVRRSSRKHPVAQALEEIPGIGPFIALLLVAEIGDIQRFPDAKPLASYTGLVPSLYASGEHRWGGAITKQGSTVLRWALVQAATLRSAAFPKRVGWRIYEGGGAVKGFFLAFVFVGLSEQPPFIDAPAGPGHRLPRSPVIPSAAISLRKGVAVVSRRLSQSISGRGLMWRGPIKIISRWLRQ